MTRRFGFRRVDRRARFLALIGGAFLVLGYSFTGDRPTSAGRDALRLAQGVMPLWGWGLLWMGTGVLVIVGAIGTRVSRWTFGLAVMPPLGWGAWYMLGWIAGDSTRGWVSALIYWMFGVAVYTVAGLIDPTVVIARTARRR